MWMVNRMSSVNLMKLYINFGILLNNFRLDTLAYPKYCCSIPNLRKTVKKNHKFKDLHKGKRCFIIGNGPSINAEDLTLLANEIVFTVNQASRLKQFSDLHSNYHFIADPLFFQLSKDKPEEYEVLMTIKNLSLHNKNIECFFPIQYKDFIEKNGLDQNLNVNYFLTIKRMYDGYNKKIDFSRPSIAFNTVVQWCITMAIYMGINEIYLLGCDCTSMISIMKSILRQNDECDYAYNITENEKKRLENTVGKMDLEDTMHGCLLQIQDYRRLYEYCKKRNIKLVNCSSETVLTSIPRASLSDVLAGNA